MGDKTGIQWTDATWNPIRGCSRVSEGCLNCYAEAMAGRFAGPGQPYEGLIRVTKSRKQWSGVVRMVPEHLADPLRWKRPRRIFVNSMSDLFHESLSNEEIAAVFGVMAACPQHTFQVLTKRAKRMREWFGWVDETGPSRHTFGAARGVRWYAWDAGVEACSPAYSAGNPPAWRWPLPNVWLGVSVENQDAADERIPELLETPAAVRFLSCEPLLGPVDLRGLDKGNSWSGGDWLRSYRREAEKAGQMVVLEERTARINWVVAGCESGPGARACKVEWLRSLRDQCQAPGVAFFLKQAVEQGREPPTDTRAPWPPLEEGLGSTRKPGGVIGLPYLDGVQHAEFPEVPRG